MWKALDEKTIGVNEDGEAKIKYAFDRVFDNQAANKQVHSVLPLASGVLHSAS